MYDCMMKIEPNPRRSHSSEASMYPLKKIITFHRISISFTVLTTAVHWILF